MHAHGDGVFIIDGFNNYMQTVSTTLAAETEDELRQKISQGHQAKSGK
jgi:hypothetical protein